MDGSAVHYSRDSLILDYFAGGGGVSIGIHNALGRGPDVAVNHDPLSIAMHIANHPGTTHLLDDVWQVDPHEDLPPGPVDLAWFSPSCTHFSRAAGGRPKAKQLRALPWVAHRVARERRPRCMIIENVAEMISWGPVDNAGNPIAEKQGATFNAFVRKIRALGYKVDWRVLNAADYGAPTARKRLFIVCRLDEPPAWPKATHGPGQAAPHKTAASCIDFAQPCPSIFDRKKPHCAKTRARIAEGLRRFVLTDANPFIVNDAIAYGVTVSYGERKGQTPRTIDLSKPLGTIVAGGIKHAIIVAWIVKHYGGVYGHRPDRPLGTITTIDHHDLAMARLESPARDTRAAQVGAFMEAEGLDLWVWGGLGYVVIDGVLYTIVDIGMRKLTPRELARAQGFPDTYILTGKKTSQVARIGNSVPPALAAAVIAANKVQ